MEGIQGQRQACAESSFPRDLKESDKLPEPIFTPATKATTGHDEKSRSKRWSEMVGAELSSQLRDLSLEDLQKAADYARHEGIIIADTKFEFGLTAEGITLADEVLTPDSSRFWPADKYQPGQGAGFLRQAVRSGLPRGNSLEQAAARASAPGGSGAQDQRKVSGGISAAHRTRAGCVSETDSSERDQ